MSRFCGAHRAPRAGVDPIDSAARRPRRRRPRDAPARSQRDRSPSSSTTTIAAAPIVVVDGTDEPDAVLEVVERVAESIAATGRAGALVVASIRPGGGPSPATTTAGSRPATSPTTSASSSSSGSSIGGDGPPSPPTRGAPATCSARRRGGGRGEPRLTCRRLRSAGAGPALRRAQPQPGGAQPAHQLAALDLDRAGGDHRRAVLLGDVVVIALEGPPRDAEAPRRSRAARRATRR